MPAPDPLSEIERVAATRWEATDPVRKRFVHLIGILAILVTLAVLGDLLAWWPVAELAGLLGVLLVFYGLRTLIRREKPEEKEGGS